MRALGMSVAKKLKKGFEGKSIGGGMGGHGLALPEGMEKTEEVYRKQMCATKEIGKTMM